MTLLKTAKEIFFDTLHHLRIEEAMRTRIHYQGETLLFDGRLPSHQILAGQQREPACIAEGRMVGFGGLFKPGIFEEAAHPAQQRLDVRFIYKG
jgi:hypothetical protein